MAFFCCPHDHVSIKRHNWIKNSRMEIFCESERSCSIFFFLNSVQDINIYFVLLINYRGQVNKMIDLPLALRSNSLEKKNVRRWCTSAENIFSYIKFTANGKKNCHNCCLLITPKLFLFAFVLMMMRKHKSQAPKMLFSYHFCDGFFRVYSDFFYHVNNGMRRLTSCLRNKRLNISSGKFIFVKNLCQLRIFDQ